MSLKRVEGKENGEHVRSLLPSFLSFVFSSFFQFHLLSSPLSFQDSPLDSGSLSHVLWSQGTCPSRSPGRRTAGQSQRASGWPLTTLTSRAPYGFPISPLCTMGITPASPGMRPQRWSTKASWLWEVRTGTEGARHQCSQIHQCSQTVFTWNNTKRIRIHRICCDPIKIKPTTTETNYKLRYHQTKVLFS